MHNQVNIGSVMVSEVSKYAEINYPAECNAIYHMTYRFKVARSTLGGIVLFVQCLQRFNCARGFIGKSAVNKLSSIAFHRYSINGK